jgi:four helix bundle protein
MKQTGNVIVDKSKLFAVRIIRLYQYLLTEKKEFVLSKQLLRSGTSIGANIKEGIRGQSVKDFRSKMAIALKEASESEYWLELLVETEYINQTQYNSIGYDCVELIKILTSILNTSEKNTVNEEIEPYKLLNNED